MPTQVPIFKAKGKCVVSDKPKFKKDSIVIRSQDGRMTIERVIPVIGKRMGRIKQPWPKELILVVRGPLARRIIDYFNGSAES